MNKGFGILLLGISLNALADQAIKKASDPTVEVTPVHMTAQHCKDLKGRIVNNLSGKEKCAPNEKEEKVIGMDCPCICCYLSR